MAAVTICSDFGAPKNKSLDLDYCDIEWFALEMNRQAGRIACIKMRGKQDLDQHKKCWPSNHLILCHPLLLLPAIFPSIRVLSNESVLHIR